MKKQLTLAGLILLFGLLDAAFGAQHAFIWDEANGMRGLGSLGGDSSGINDSGTVVGWYVKGSGYRGFHLDRGGWNGGRRNTRRCWWRASDLFSHRN